jgi:hypothetical protein
MLATFSIFSAFPKKQQQGVMSPFDQTFNELNGYEQNAPWPLGS